MPQFFRKTALILGLALAISGCRGATPVYNVESEPLSVVRPATLQEVETAIRRAAARIGWTVKRLGPRKLEGRVVVRRHVALVDITYTTKEFSITYKDSQNLKYTGTTIHKNYNNWVLNLARAINVEISGI